MRQSLYHLLVEALTAAGIGRGQCEFADRGDGALVVIDPDVAKINLVGPFVERLTVGLRRYNRAASEEARMRLRVVFHAGEIARDQHGFHGTELTFAFRMLDSDQARTCLARTVAPLVLLIADEMYQRVIEQSTSDIDPSAYQPIWFSTKETTAHAWACAPGDPSAHVIGHSQPRQRSTGRGRDRAVPMRADKRLARLHRRQTQERWRALGATISLLGLIALGAMLSTRHFDALQVPLTAGCVDMVRIDSPVYAPARGKADVTGVARICDGHDLWLLVRPTNLQRTYFATTPGPLKVGVNGRWILPQLPMECSTAGGITQELVALVTSPEGSSVIQREIDLLKEPAHVDLGSVPGIKAQSSVTVVTQSKRRSHAAC